mmetsp:Transcript_29938/g.81135  ORF Transcript_29938/g.81135 Transcript_29938/m.81135 type:complete len:269 (-) Transcript_29938:140-946(-)
MHAHMRRTRTNQLHSARISMRHSGLNPPHARWRQVHLRAPRPPPALLSRPDAKLAQALNPLLFCLLFETPLQCKCSNLPLTCRDLVGAVVPISPANVLIAVLLPREWRALELGQEDILPVIPLLAVAVLPSELALLGAPLLPEPLFLALEGLLRHVERTGPRPFLNFPALFLERVRPVTLVDLVPIPTVLLLEVRLHRSIKDGVLLRRPRGLLCFAIISELRIDYLCTEGHAPRTDSRDAERRRADKGTSRRQAARCAQQSQGGQEPG